MKNISLAILLIGFLITGCDKKPNTSSLENKTNDSINLVRDKQHDVGHPADPPPPCSRCNDFISRLPNDTLLIKSFRNYHFVKGTDTNDEGTEDEFYYMIHKSKVDAAISDGTKVTIDTVERHYLVDCDTIYDQHQKDSAYIFFPTGTELLLVNKILKVGQGDFTFRIGKNLLDSANRLKNASLVNAGFVKESNSLTSKGYLSQDYYFYPSKSLSDASNKNSFYMHVEPMMVLKEIPELDQNGRMKYDASYNMDFAVDILLIGHDKSDYRFHALGNHDHNHLTKENQIKHSHGGGGKHQH